MTLQKVINQTNMLDEMANMSQCIADYCKRLNLTDSADLHLNQANWFSTLSERVWAARPNAYTEPYQDMEFIEDDSNVIPFTRSKP